MVNTKFTKFVTLFVTAVLSLTFVNAAANFNLNLADVTENVVVGQTKTINYVIENTGSSPLNFSISKTNPVVSGESVATSLSKTSISNLAVGATNSFSVTYSPSAIPSGNYVGQIKVVDSSNSAEFETSDVTLNVSTPAGALLEITSFDNNKVELTGEIDEKETKSFKIKNVGTVDLTNLRFKFYDLEGEEENDEIEDNDVEIDDDGFDLDVGDSEKVELEIDIPNKIEVDTYVGKAIVETDEGYVFEYEIELEIDGGDIEIEFDESSLSVSSGILKMVGEPGERVNDYEFKIENVGDINVRDLEFELKGDLGEMYSDESLDESIVTFSDSQLDLEASDYEKIEVTVNLPDNAKAGVYSGEIRVKSSTGTVYDKLRIEVKVIGDVFVSEIEYDENVEQNDNLDVTVTIENQGSKTEKNVKVTGTLIGIDLGSSDIIESTNSFLLSSGKTKTETLRFNIPESAEDGTHTLELTLTYDDGTITELKEIQVSRPDNSLSLESSGIGQNIIKCDDSLYTFAKVKNIGKYDQKVTFSVEIEGTGVKKEIKDINVDVDDSFQQNFNLPTTDIEPGTYTVVTKISYSGFFLKDTNTLIVNSCNGGSTDIDIKPIEDNDNNGNNTIDGDSKTFELFGQQLEQNQVYLIIGISVVFVLIVISLFFI